jgi:hypothetical protein
MKDLAENSMNDEKLREMLKIIWDLKKIFSTSSVMTKEGIILQRKAQPYDNKERKKLLIVFKLHEYFIGFLKQNEIYLLIAYSNHFGGET